MTKLFPLMVIAVIGAMVYPMAVDYIATETLNVADSIARNMN